MIRCRNCGRQTEEKLFCEFCGYPLEEDSDEIFFRNRKRVREYSTVTAAGLVLLAVGSVIFFYFAFFG
ncbi:MAG: hypothetical protein E7621_07280 [Ruminococcaceae bacterium]|nr:hypothetical protein [Oscillospiraceae bacterium]